MKEYKSIKEGIGSPIHYDIDVKIVGDQLMVTDSTPGAFEEPRVSGINMKSGKLINVEAYGMDLRSIPWLIHNICIYMVNNARNPNSQRVLNRISAILDKDIDIP